MLLLDAARQFDDGSRRILDCAKVSNLAAPPSLGDSNRNRVFVDVQADECVDLRHEPFSWKTSPAGSQGPYNWTASAAPKKGHCHLSGIDKQVRPPRSLLVPLLGPTLTAHIPFESHQSFSVPPRNSSSRDQVAVSRSWNGTPTVPCGATQPLLRNRRDDCRLCAHAHPHRPGEPTVTEEYPARAIRHTHVGADWASEWPRRERFRFCGRHTIPASPPPATLTPSGTNPASPLD